MPTLLRIDPYTRMRSILPGFHPKLITLDDARASSMSSFNLEDVAFSSGGLVYKERCSTSEHRRRIANEGTILLGIDAFWPIWQNKKLIPEAWMEFHTILFLGTEFTGPQHQVTSPCLYFNKSKDGGRWHWGRHHIGEEFSCGHRTVAAVIR